MSKLVLSLMADDRPGLVRRLSNVVADHGGNWLESRFAQLSGKFAGVVNIEAPPDRIDALIAALDALESDGLQLLVRRGGVSAPAAKGVTMELDIVGADHPGIVHEITDLLARRGVNVEEMSSDRKPASMSGNDMFEAWLRVHVPADSDQAQLRSDLEKLARDLLVDVRLSAQETAGRE